MPELDIAGFVPKSTTDWRGKISSVVLVPGCNFACPYCFSHQLIVKPEKLPKIPVHEILSFVAQRSNNIRAVVVTGGEPTLHGNRLLRFLEQTQELGLLNRIETNGSNPFMVRTLIEQELVDSIVLDLKAPLYAAKYSDAVRKNAVLGKIKRSVQLVLDSGIDYEFRIVVIPGKTTEKDIQSISRSVRGAKRLVLHQFSPLGGTLDPVFEQFPLTSYDQLIEAAQKISGIQEVRIKTDKGEELVQQLPQLKQFPKPE